MVAEFAGAGYNVIRSLHDCDINFARGTQPVTDIGGYHLMVPVIYLLVKISIWA